MQRRGGGKLDAQQIQCSGAPIGEVALVTCAPVESCKWVGSAKAAMAWEVPAINEYLVAECEGKMNGGCIAGYV